MFALPPAADRLRLSNTASVGGDEQHDMSEAELQPAVPKAQTPLVSVPSADVAGGINAGKRWHKLVHRHQAMGRAKASGHVINNVAEMGVTCWPWLDEKGRTNVVKQAKHACELSGWKNPAFLATLAAAQALNRRFRCCTPIAGRSD